MTGIAVVGLRRGGTSAVAGVLNHLGVFMGDQLLEPSEDNPKGYFEDIRFMELHTAIMGGDWRRPVDNFKRDVWPEYKDEYTALVEKFEYHAWWGVKDPRLCYCLPLLQEAVSDKLKVVYVYRDPWAAALSLRKRGGHTFEEAWTISFYHLAAMVETMLSSRDCHCLNYDALVLKPNKVVGVLAEYLDIEVDTQSAVGYIDPTLRHWYGDLWESEEEEEARENREPVACCPHCGTYGACTYMNEEHIPRCAELHGGEK